MILNFSNTDTFNKHVVNLGRNWFMQDGRIEDKEIVKEKEMEEREMVSKYLTPSV